MVLSARFLDLANVNAWRPLTQGQMVQGDPVTLYLQLMDVGVLLPSEGFNPSGRRYCPPAGSTLQVTLVNIDSNKQVARMASQPFATLDASIWGLTMMSTDPIEGTVSLLLTLTEPGPVVKHGSAAAALLINSQNPTQC